MEENKLLLLPSCTILPLPSEKLKDLIPLAKDWALLHGLSFRPETNSTKDILKHNRFTLLPSVFPKAEFKSACEIQTTLNLLMHRVARDYDFLKETLAPTIKADEFIRKIFEIYETVHSEGFTQKIFLVVMRSDLMLDTTCPNRDKIKKPYCCWKQVEINTIACGMSAAGPVSTDLHKFILRELGLYDSIKCLPENKATDGVCNGILDAWRMYDEPQAQILFIVEDFSTNLSDQRLVEFRIKLKNPEVKVVRRSLTQLINGARLGSNKELIVDNKTIAVAYFRSGYEPGQYPTEKEWEVRLLIERSLAIKCPPIQYQLAGTKKVQQVLADTEVLARYLEDEDTVSSVHQIFTGLYSLGVDGKENEAMKMALANPERFVLKPQREGGGNNIYGKDIKTFLESMKPCERSAWILMDRIIPPPQLNYLISPGQVKSSIRCDQVVVELGIFGVFMGDEKSIFINEQVGHTCRTKPASDNEAGLSLGSGGNDSPFLIDL